MVGGHVSLDVDGVVRRGDFELALQLRAPARAVTAVLGPNGSGKSTLLDCVAGTVRLSVGSLLLGGAVLDEPPEPGLPPSQRRVGMVHQDLLLFPKMTVLENVAFAPRCAGVTRPRARELARSWLDRVGAAALADRRPAELSGGQAQRVALARALAGGPRALLLDEPLSALDAGTRVEIRRELRRHLDSFDGPTVLVTHDPVDVLALADRVAILESGAIVQQGPVEDVTRRPRSRYVAELIGTNLLHGAAKGAAIDLADGPELRTAEAHDGPVFLTIDPAAVSLHLAEPEGSPRNRWPTVVAHLDRLGERVRVQLGGPLPIVAEVTASAAAELALAEGLPVWVSVKATEVVAYPR